MEDLLGPLLEIFAELLPFRVTAWLVVNGSFGWGAAAWLAASPGSLAPQAAAFTAWLVLPLAGLILLFGSFRDRSAADVSGAKPRRSP